MAPSSFFGNRVLRAFGKFSYAMYVFNKPIIAAIIGALMVTQLPFLLGPDVTLALFVALAVLLLRSWPAVISWHLFEKHALRLKRYFQTERAAAK